MKSDEAINLDPVVDRDWNEATQDVGAKVPSDLVHQAAGRVKYVALAGVLLFATSLIVALLTHRASPEPSWAEHFYHLHEGMAFLVALAIFELTRGDRLSPQLRSDLGIVLQLGVAALIGFLEADRFMIYADWEFDPPSGGVSVLCLWVMIFPILVPQSIRRTIFISILVALALPLAAFGRSFVGNDVAWPVLVGWQLPIVLSAIFAVATATIVNNLRRKVAQARLMGSYKLEEKLGEGGMGEVWRAQHRMLSRPAAVKLIRPEKLQRDHESNEQTHRRFKNEAQATAALRSPHTVELYDYGRAGDGAFFYVMEFLDGIDLHNLVAKFGAQPQDRVIHILKQCCASLEDAHRHGLIHRDIKPANIMLCKLGTHLDFVKILDFGLVRSTLEAQQEFAPESQSDGPVEPVLAGGPINGTPAYMSPELIRNDEDIDGRSDIYALGCTAYWLLSGTAVFGHGASAAILKDHLEKKPQPIGKRVNTIHPELESLVMACLEKAPEDRPGSAQEFMEALSAIQLAAKWSHRDARKWWQRYSEHTADQRQIGTVEL